MNLMTFLMSRWMSNTSEWTFSALFVTFSRAFARESTILVNSRTATEGARQQLGDLGLNCLMVRFVRSDFPCGVHARFGGLVELSDRRARGRWHPLGWRVVWAWALVRNPDVNGGIGLAELFLGEI